MAGDFIAKVEIVVNAPVERVWDALVNPDIIKQYLFGTEVSSDWKVGSAVVYRGEWQGRRYEDKGTILELIPNERLVSTFWSSLGGLPDAPENYNTVTWEIENSDSGAKLTLTQDNNPSRESADHSANNWRMALAKIKELLEA